MKILSYMLFAIMSASLVATAEDPVSVDSAERAIDDLQNQLDHMSNDEIAQALNLNEHGGEYLLSGLVDKAKSFLQGAKEKIKGGFDWLMCKTVAKLNPLTTFLCKIPDLQKSNASGQGYLNAFKSAFGVK